MLKRAVAARRADDARLDDPAPSRCSPRSTTRISATSGMLGATGDARAAARARRLRRGRALVRVLAARGALAARRRSAPTPSSSRPGVRAAERGDQDDQKRVATPAQAIADGADWRRRRAPDPRRRRSARGRRARSRAKRPQAMAAKRSAVMRLIAGLQPVREAIRVHGDKLERVFVENDGGSPQIDAVARFAEDRGADVDARRREPSSIAWRTARGTRARSRSRPSSRSCRSRARRSTSDALVVALDEIEDPQNFGARSPLRGGPRRDGRSSGPSTTRRRSRRRRSAPRPARSSTRPSAAWARLPEALADAPKAGARSSASTRTATSASTTSSSRRRRPRRRRRGQGTAARPSEAPATSLAPASPWRGPSPRSTPAPGRDRALRSPTAARSGSPLRKVTNERHRVIGHVVLGGDAERGVSDFAVEA